MTIRTSPKPSWKQHSWSKSYAKVIKVIRVAAEAGMIDAKAALDAQMILTQNPQARLDALAERTTHMRIAYEHIANANHALFALQQLCEKDLEEIQEVVSLQATYQREEEND